MQKRQFIFIIMLLFIATASYAIDDYKPYLHEASIPKSPNIRMFGQYSTNAFAGAATYTYPIEIPKGINGFQPSLSVSYNSQSMKQTSGILGAGWSLNSDYIYRDINGTINNTNDDEYILFLDGMQYQLVYGSDNRWHTEVEYYFNIENTFGHWTLITKNGIKYRFGYDANSKLESVNNYFLIWNVDLVTDLYDNSIYYSYSKDPFLDDRGAIYLDKIEYNDDKLKTILFTYENNLRPDSRLIFREGNAFMQSRRISDISIYANNNFIRRYNFDFIELNSAMTSLSTINYYGSDNISIFHNATFEYYSPNIGYNKSITNWAAPYLFSSLTTEYGVRMIDINQDGYVDIIKSKEGEAESVWINNKENNWTISNEWNIPHNIITSGGYDNGVRFIDVNGDGYIDFLKADQNVREVYLNNGTDWNLSSWYLPEYFVNSYIDQGVRFGDVNGDGKIDILKGKDSSTHVYYNNGSGWTFSSLNLPIVFDVASVDTGARLIDLNSDGYIDILKAKNNDREAWINNGSGWVNDSKWIAPLDFVTDSKLDTGTRFLDVNSDGLIDILVDFFNGSETNKGAWLNTGKGWQANTSWQSPEAFTSNGKNTGRRLSDVNGDGLMDVMVSYDNLNNIFTWTRNHTLPYLLKKVKNEYGGVFVINYTTSTSFNNSNLGFNLFVVSKTTMNNSVLDDFNVLSVIEYNYSLGKYDYLKSEFRGFGNVTEIMSDKIINYCFYQDSPRRGKEYIKEIYSSNGSLFVKNLKDYNYSYADGIYNISLIYSTNYMYDSLSTPKITNLSYVYDVYQNLQSLYDYGDVLVIGDEKVTNYTYAYSISNWIMNKVSLVSTFDLSNNLVSEVKYYYDNLGLNGMGKRGSLTKIEHWNNYGNNTFKYYSYDDYGNIISETDSLGNTIKYNYDFFHTYPSSIVNPLGYISYYDYDLGTGNLNFEENNNIKTSYEYNIFGQIVKEILPYDTIGFPTKKYEYFFDGVAPEIVKISFKTTSNNTNKVLYYYDGFSKLLQIKSDVEDDKQTVKNIFYDSQYRISKEQNPYFETSSDSLGIPSSTVSNTYYSYDTLDRVVGVLSSDGTNKSIVFNQYNITDYDEKGNKHKYTLDGRGRILAVYEYNLNYLGMNEVYMTTYKYDTNDNLIEIVDNDANSFFFSYDSLNRKISMNDPDLGMWIYKYNQNGNLIKQTDARGENIYLEYDSLNRVLNKQSNNINISFGYDKDFYGTLSNLTLDDIIYKYKYDNRLRVINETKDINNVSLSILYVYDSLDRIISKNGRSKLDYIFNKNGKVKQISGIVLDSNYNAFGSTLNRTFVNGLIGRYEYNLSNNRLRSITIPNVQDLLYDYDSVGNIIYITDSISNNDHILSYDNLDRLTNAKIGDDNYIYSYNSIGNIMKIVNNDKSKKFVYNGEQVHAPSKIIEGNAGVDVYNVNELNFEAKNRVLEFYLLNDKSSQLSGVNVSVDFGDGTIFSSTSININDSILVLAENNYSFGGDYDIVVTASSSGISDIQNKNLKFGTRAKSFEEISSNASSKIFAFEIINDLNESVTNVSWNCSNGISSTTTKDLSGGEVWSDDVLITYSLPGYKEFVCTVVSDDGHESLSSSFEIKGLEIDDYDVLYENISKQIVMYDIVNHFSNLDLNISDHYDNDTYLKQTILLTNENIMVFNEINYSTDGYNKHFINAVSSNYSTDYLASSKIEGVSVLNYKSTSNNSSDSFILFDVKNNWHNGNVDWSFNKLSINESTYLENNETLMVIIEDENLKQENSYFKVTAKTSDYVDNIKDLFTIEPLQISSLLTLYEGDFAVSEMLVKNNVNSNQSFSWQFNSGIQSVFSDELINIDSDDVMIFIESNYSVDGVYQTKGTVNSSVYNDTETGVIVR